MKNFILLSIFMLSFNFINGQQEMTIPTKDSESFTWKDGYGNYVEVAFSYNINDELPQETIKMAVMNIMTQSKYKLNNKLSFVPVKLSFIQMEEKYRAISVFRGKNAYGAESETKAFFQFNEKGDVTGL